MLRLIKRSAIIVCISFTCCYSGCTFSSAYYEGNSDDWLQEQVQQGYLTQEEADELRKQEK